MRVYLKGWLYCEREAFIISRTTKEQIYTSSTLTTTCNKEINQTTTCRWIPIGWNKRHIVRENMRGLADFKFLLSVSFWDADWLSTASSSFLLENCNAENYLHPSKQKAKWWFCRFFIWRSLLPSFDCCCRTLYSLPSSFLSLTKTSLSFKPCQKQLDQGRFNNITIRESTLSECKNCPEQQSQSEGYLMTCFPLAWLIALCANFTLKVSYHCCPSSHSFWISFLEPKISMAMMTGAPVWLICHH